MRPMIALLLGLLLATLATPVEARPTKGRATKASSQKAFGFVTAWSGAKGKLVFDVRHRSDGTTVVSYKGQRRDGKKTLAFEGNFRGKLTGTNRTLRNGFGFVTVPKVGPSSAGKPGFGKALFWGTARDGFDFSITAKGADAALVAFDVPLVGFDVPLVGFDEPILFHGVAVSTLGGGMKGIAVARKVGGKTVVSFAAKVGAKMQTGTLGGASSDRKSAKKKGILDLSRGGMGFSGRFAGAKTKVSALTGTLRIKVGKSWKAGATRFVALDKALPGPDW